MLPLVYFSGMGVRVERKLEYLGIPIFLASAVTLQKAQFQNAI